MLNNHAPSRALDRPSVPLTDLEIISTAQLLQSVPEFVPEPLASVARQALGAARNLKGTATIWLALWPDGTCSMLAHNPDWPRPRPEQLVRAYRAAYSAGIFLPGTRANSGSPMLGGS